MPNDFHAYLNFDATTLLRVFRRRWASDDCAAVPLSGPPCPVDVQPHVEDAILLGRS
jgi:hypothetical protein